MAKLLASPLRVHEALDAAVMDHEPPAGLPAARAHPAPTAQPDRHDHPSPVKLTSMTDAPGRRSSLLNAVVTRTSPSLAGPLFSTTSSLAPGGGCASLRSAQRPQTSHRPGTRPRAGTSRRSDGYVTHKSTGDPEINPIVRSSGQLLSHRQRRREVPGERSLRRVAAQAPADQAQGPLPARRRGSRLDRRLAFQPRPSPAQRHDPLPRGRVSHADNIIAEPCAGKPHARKLKGERGTRAATGGHCAPDD